ncbi:biosynthetic peptidoglycan transglycosylase [Fodinicurvata fenggangensis]|uniref:biosynthetic peptidoglycan transglycosylase n=1 Tax=Fodinicurvata fenggangensis TaxID=1121830 RepID=UPI0009E003FF|nr:biosynthetic peptidoglycan transglycosylase [Fodinicurvata fenggangensis]
MKKLIRKYNSRNINKYNYHYKLKNIMWPPAPKQILIALNISADKVVNNIDKIALEENYLSIINYNKISNLEWSVLLLEDRRFFEHSGLEIIRSILRTIRRILSFKRIGGISTIEQQIVRTILDDRRRNISRKLRESVIANAINYRVKKIDILRSYLSIAYTGYKLKGADSASLMIFGKKAIDLSESQADLIASLLVYPVPKAIYMRKDKILPLNDCQEIINITNNYSPIWSKNIKRRMLYAAHLRGNSIKPSYEIY